MRLRYFPGWNVVGATFVMALFSFGLGFYGLSVHVATLQRLHGWSAASVSAPVTVYYVAGALMTVWIGDLFGRFGPRAVVIGGSFAMAAGLAALGRVTQPWQLYPTFLLMSLGWGAMSGAAINIILAPWFQRRRGLAVSLAFNGATLGGVLIAPALIFLIEGIGFTRALSGAGLVLLAVMLPLAATIMRRGPATLGLGPDGGPDVVGREAHHVARGIGIASAHLAVRAQRERRRVEVAEHDESRDLNAHREAQHVAVERQQVAQVLAPDRCSRQPLDHRGSPFMGSHTFQVLVLRRVLGALGCRHRDRLPLDSSSAIAQRRPMLVALSLVSRAERDEIDRPGKFLGGG
jgi:hypothetical protein